MSIVLTPGQKAFIYKYFRLIHDDQAVAWIVEEAEKPYAEASQLVSGIRQKARIHGIGDDVNIHAEVRPGCIFKRDIPKMGPTHEGFQYLQEWNFPDPPTEYELVSWIPKPLVASRKKNLLEQMALIHTFKTESELPIWYEPSFGSLSHIAGMAFAHFNATANNPFGPLTVRTDICHATDRYIFELNWNWDDNNSYCLFCDNWNLGSVRLFDLAVFLVGVVKAVVRPEPISAFWI